MVLTFQVVLYFLWYLDFKSHADDDDDNDDDGKDGGSEWKNARYDEDANLVATPNFDGRRYTLTKCCLGMYVFSIWFFVIAFCCFIGLATPGRGKWVE